MTNECGEGAASAADMIAMIGAGAIQTPRGRPMAADMGGGFHVYRKSRSEWRLFGP